MDDKIKEMIAVGASVTANCIPCLQYHFAKACDAGLTIAEIRAAVQIGKGVRKGAAQKWDEEVSVLLGSSSGEQKATCGCRQ